MLTLQDKVTVEDPYGDFCRSERYSYDAMRQREDRDEELNY